MITENIFLKNIENLFIFLINLRRTFRIFRCYEMKLKNCKKFIDQQKSNILFLQNEKSIRFYFAFLRFNLFFY